MPEPSREVNSLIGGLRAGRDKSFRRPRTPPVDVVRPVAAASGSMMDADETTGKEQGAASEAAPEQPTARPPRMAGRNIVCFSTADWDTLLPTNKHHLMARLARRNRVLFVETLGTRAPRLGSGPDAARVVRRIKRGMQGAIRRSRNLWTFSPIVRPAWESGPSRAANRFLFQAQGAAALRAFPRPIAWIYSPYAVHLLDHLDPHLVVYHLVDDLAAVPGANAGAIRDAEARLFARADRVFCTERSLFDRASRSTGRARFMPNVADFRHFREATEGVDDPRLAPLAAQGDARPLLVFSGHVAPHKVDLGLLAGIAAARPAWRVALVGPEWEGGEESPELAALRGLENVTLVGHVPYRVLPAFLHAADVLLIPYVRNKATRAVFPLKFFEYLAVGAPVVASPLPSLLPYRDCVQLAESTEQWLSACEAAIADPDRMRDQRIALARRHTWDVRLREMERELRLAEEEKGG